MAQTFKMMLGTSGKQWEQLTVKDDGTMMLYFHGTNQSVTQEVTVITEGEWKGWLRNEKGSLFPGLESGRWQLMADVRGLRADVVETNTNDTNSANEVAEPETTTDCTDCTDNEPVIVNQPRPRRQRKPRKPRVERQPSAISHQTSDIDRQPSDIDRQSSDIDRHQTSSTLKAIGMVAAATVALFVIYETGLLIPLGLIGLATGGILK